MSSLLRALARDDRGVALVEFALVMPVLLLLLVGTLDIARAVNAYVVVNSASREGVRVAALAPGSSYDEIVAAVRARSAPLDEQAVQVTVAYYNETAKRWTQCADARCGTWPAPALASPTPMRVRVDVAYPWNAVTWMAGQFFAGGTGSQTFASTSTGEARR
jgi:Flp pilus assembly protein TadG